MDKQEASEAAKSLGTALDILQKNGWIKGSPHNKNGYCLIGAIQEANGPGHNEASRIVERLIGCSITTWNDAPSRQFEEVKTVLIAARNIALELAE